MQNELLSMFKAITPDNIKNLLIISDSMEIFIELLEQYSPISLNIKTSLSEDTTPKIEEELPKVYLYDYYSMIENLRNNKTIVNKFKKWNDALNPNIYPIGMPIIGDRLVIDYFMIGQEGATLKGEDENTGDDGVKWNISPLSDKLDILKQNILQNKAENYYINRKFKESKGLKKSIQFIYDIVNEHIVNPDERKPLEITETGNPFEFDIISGSMDKDIYKQSVAYLSHPLGFTYNYVYVSELVFTDDYKLRKIYDVRMLEVRCLSGNVEKYNKEVIYIEEKVNYLKIVFVDGMYLLQENDMVKYFDKDDIIIKAYPPGAHCSIFIDYSIIYRITYDDDLKFQDRTGVQDNFEINDSTIYNEIIKIKKGFIIGLGIIGEEVISNDVEYFDTLFKKDEILFKDFGKSEDNFSILDNINVSGNKNVDEVFNIMNAEEDFSIENNKKGFIIGLGIIGAEVISNEIEYF